MEHIKALEGYERQGAGCRFVERIVYASTYDGRTIIFGTIIFGTSMQCTVLKQLLTDLSTVLVRFYRVRLLPPDILFWGDLPVYSYAREC